MSSSTIQPSPTWTCWACRAYIRSEGLFFVFSLGTVNGVCFVSSTSKHLAQHPPWGLYFVALELAAIVIAPHASLNPLLVCDLLVSSSPRFQSISRLLVLRLHGPLSLVYTVPTVWLYYRLLDGFAIRPDCSIMQPPDLRSTLQPLFPFHHASFSTRAMQATRSRHHCLPCQPPLFFGTWSNSVTGFDASFQPLNE